MLTSALKFARIRIIVTCFAIVFLGSAAAGAITFKTYLSFILIVAFTIHANSINDYADRDIDAVNLKNATDRPLVTKDISYKKLWIINLTAGGLLVALSTLYGIGAVLLTIAVLGIDYAYSVKPVRIANRAIATPILLSATYVYYSFSIGYWSVDNPRAYPWALTIGLVLGFIARLLLKDFRDVKGDRKHGKITFLLRYGPKMTCIVSGAFWLFALYAVAYATSFRLGVTIPLLVGLLEVAALLRQLVTSRTIANQQIIISFIAKAANSTILTILVYLLCRNQTNTSDGETQLLTAMLGTILLTFNWVNFKTGGYVGSVK